MTERIGQQTQASLPGQGRDATSEPGGGGMPAAQLLTTAGAAGLLQRTSAQCSRGQWSQDLFLNGSGRYDGLAGNAVTAGVLHSGADQLFQHQFASQRSDSQLPDFAAQQCNQYTPQSHNNAAGSGSTPISSQDYNSGSLAMTGSANRAGHQMQHTPTLPPSFMYAPGRSATASGFGYSDHSLPPIDHQAFCPPSFYQAPSSAGLQTGQPVAAAAGSGSIGSGPTQPRQPKRGRPPKPGAANKKAKTKTSHAAEGEQQQQQKPPKEPGNRDGANWTLPELLSLARAQLGRKHMEAASKVMRIESASVKSQAAWVSVAGRLAACPAMACRTIRPTRRWTTSAQIAADDEEGDAGSAHEEGEISSPAPGERCQGHRSYADPLVEDDDADGSTDPAVASGNSTGDHGPTLPARTPNTTAHSTGRPRKGSQSSGTVKKTSTRPGRGGISDATLQDLDASQGIRHEQMLQTFKETAQITAQPLIAMASAMQAMAAQFAANPAPAPIAPAPASVAPPSNAQPAAGNLTVADLENDPALMQHLQQILMQAAANNPATSAPNDAP